MLKQALRHIHASSSQQQHKSNMSRKVQSYRQSQQQQQRKLIQQQQNSKLVQNDPSKIRQLETISPLRQQQQSINRNKSSRNATIDHQQPQRRKFNTKGYFVQIEPYCDEYLKRKHQAYQKSRHFNYQASTSMNKQNHIQQCVYGLEQSESLSLLAAKHATKRKKSSDKLIRAKYNQQRVNTTISYHGEDQPAPQSKSYLGGRGKETLRSIKERTNQRASMYRVKGNCQNQIESLRNPRKSRNPQNNRNPLTALDENRQQFKPQPQLVPSQQHRRNQKLTDQFLKKYLSRKTRVLRKSDKGLAFPEREYRMKLLEPHTRSKSNYSMRTRSRSGDSVSDISSVSKISKAKHFNNRRYKKNKANDQSTQDNQCACAVNAVLEKLASNNKVSVCRSKTTTIDYTEEVQRRKYKEKEKETIIEAKRFLKPKVLCAKSQTQSAAAFYRKRVLNNRQKRSKTVIQ